MGKKVSSNISIKQAVELARPYKNRPELAADCISLINIILRNHWEEICFAHMENLGIVDIEPYVDILDISCSRKKKQPPFSLEECQARCEECKTQKELKDRFPKVLNCIKYHYPEYKDSLFANFVRAQKNAHTLEECMEIASMYSSASEMVNSEHNHILEYIRKHGWFEICCSRFKKIYAKRTIPEAIAEVQNYPTYQQLKDENPSLLSFITRHGLIETCLEDLPGYEERKVRLKELFFDVPAIEGSSQRLTYKFRTPFREDLANYLRIANNLYNQTVFEFRTALHRDDNPQWLSHYSLRERMRDMPNLEGEYNYRLLPNDNMADRVIQSVAVACNEYARRCRNHEPGENYPGLPGFRPKGDMYQLRFAQKKGGRRYIRNGKINLCDGIEIPIPCFDDYKERLRHLVMGTIIPRRTHFEVALTYDTPLAINPNVDESEYASIDIGLQNLITMVDRNQTTIYHGGFLKSYNQYYNDQLRLLRRAVQHEIGKPYTKRMNSLVSRRNAYMEDVTHKISRHIVDYLLKNQIGVLIIGWNSDIQQDSNLRGNTKRLFQLIPFGKLISKLRYKCEQVGIHVVTTEESYTSKCDALALETIGHHEKYLGKRIHRGLFKSSTGRTINADVNGAINIMRKVIGDCSFVKEIISKGHLFCPVGYSNPFEWKSCKQEQTALSDGR